jgi:type VI protein secretion system component Hcp
VQLGIRKTIRGELGEVDQLREDAIRLLENFHRRIANSTPRIVLPILIACACLLPGTTASAQDHGYMRVMTSVGQMPGESTDPAYDGWIPLRQADMPSQSKIAAMAEESSASASSPDAKPAPSTMPASGSRKPSDTPLHKPVVIVKDADKSSLALLSAYTSHRHFTEIDIVLTKGSDQPKIEYKLTDATVVSFHSGVDDGSTEGTREQVKISYAKIEIVPQR